MSSQNFLAVDLGASSGRVMQGAFDGSTISLSEVHRFENGGVEAAGTLYWNYLHLWQQIKQGLRQASTLPGDTVSIGVDTWGVDFMLLGKRDIPLGNPVHYRDQRNQGMQEKALAKLGREYIFSQTGLQFMQFNTLYQLLALREQNASLLASAETFLMMPDLFHWLLTGEKTNEFTNATTTQCFNPTAHHWATELLSKLELPTGIFLPVVEPGTRLGGLRPGVSDQVGLKGVQVIAPGTHDTASAILSVPAASGPTAKPDWCYLSSGTWSLMGAELPGPVITPACSKFNFTNEGGVGQSIRLLKNITGLWLVQECQRIWVERGQHFDWATLTRLAMAAPKLAAFVNPDDVRFMAPSNMPAEILAACQQSGQSISNDPGAIIRCAIESLALRYRQVLAMLEELLGYTLTTIHIVGGGARNELLCQATADACQRRVVCGPVEATALGNVLMQAISQGAISDIGQARQVVRNSFEVVEYLPQSSMAWEEAFARYETVTGT